MDLGLHQSMTLRSQKVMFKRDFGHYEQSVSSSSSEEEEDYFIEMT
jgi:hypothetical protein